jgi:hypothetical protein
MQLVFISLSLGAVLELSIYLALPVWRARRVVAAVAVLATAFASGGLVAYRPFTLWGVLFGVLGAYRVLNLLRIVEARMHPRYLRRVAWRTGVALLILQAFDAAGWAGWNRWHTTGRITWTLVCSLQLLVAGILVWAVRRNLARTRWSGSGTSTKRADADLPTVSVAIPARNETDDLDQCLRSILANDYPKLEVLVLDDCSQDKRTPEIIRQFAHDGVRFIQGAEPSDTWLPKNAAYARLAVEASGDYILFCGVDARFAPDSIRQLVGTMLDKNKQMMSILPRRQQSAYANASLIQAMRYMWELVPPRRIFRRPPVLSTCWIITRAALQKAGGFESVRRAIVPEAHFAYELVESDGYSFMRSSTGLGIESIKQVADQRDTVVRMRYPQLHRRPEWVFAVAASELFFLVMPFVLAVAGSWLGVGGVAQICSLVTSLLLVVVYEAVVLNTHVNTWWFGIVGLPCAVLVDVALMHYSMWRYEFSYVDWKGRNVCTPVMHVTPHLPQL